MGLVEIQQTIQSVLMKHAQPRRSRPRTRASHKPKSSPPRTATQYHAKPEKFKDMWDRVVNVVSKMRTEKTSLQRAARELGISPRTVKRWAGSALQKPGSGKWIAKRYAFARADDPSIRRDKRNRGARFQASYAASRILECRASISPNRRCFTAPYVRGTVY